MSSLSELIALTQVYLLQEYSLKEWIFSDPDTYQFFKARAAKSKALVVKTEAPAVPIEQPIQNPKIPEKISEKISGEIIEKVVDKPVVKHTPQVIEKPLVKEPQKIDIASKVPEKPVPEKPVEEIKTTKGIFSPEPLGKAKEADMAEMRKNVAARLPQVKIVAPASLARVVVLSMGETGEELLFLHNVASAIDRLLMTAEVVPIAKLEQWHTLLSREGLSWVVLFGEGAYKLPGIKKGEEVQKIGQVSLLLQPSVQALLKDQTQKSALWKLLKHYLK